ncbi:MAG: methylmalonyl Co-A mutase-associated GTPase MeaB [Candidatus Dormibacteria bacterium]
MRPAAVLDPQPGALAAAEPEPIAGAVTGPDEALVAELERRLLGGDLRALARAISLAEDRDPRVRPLLETIYPRTGRAHLVGVTGAPGAGKSTVVDALVQHLRGAGRRVAVVAVDPTSPFSGGALLGDRVRMGRHTLDGGVYIRSMAARGHLGGLSAATRDTVRLLDAFGFEEVIVETVGVGQSELEVMEVVDTVVLLLTPTMGDAVQTIKAGIMEIADVFCVNKADLPGVPKVLEEIRQLIMHSTHRDGWPPAVVKTIATQEGGVEGLWEAVVAHHRHLEGEGLLRSRRLGRLREEVASIVAETAEGRAYALMQGEGPIRRLLEEGVERRVDPHEIARAIERAQPGEEK